MAEQPALEARALSKRFSTCVALDRVDLAVGIGSVHGLLGPNGAGKTTLMRVLLGLMRGDAGSVTLLGHSRDVTTARPLPDGVAGVIDGSGFYPYLTGRTNLALLGRLDNAATSGGHARVDRVVEQTGLTEVADRTVGQYSAGMKQRLGLAAALLRSPRLLIVDEPTSALDPGSARDVRDLFRELAVAGVAIVLSSHDMAEVEALCDTLTVLDHGRVIFAGTGMDLRRLAPAPLHLLRTSDDAAALGVAARRSGVQVERIDDDGLHVSADLGAFDAYVVALGRAGVAVRALERRPRSLESLFLELTRHDSAVNAVQSRSDIAVDGLRRAAS